MFLYERLAVSTAIHGGADKEEKKRWSFVAGCEQATPNVNSKKYKSAG